LSGCLAFVDDLSRDQSLPRAELDMLAQALGDGLSPGPGGVVDDGLAELMPWDIDLSGITAPTRIMLAREDPDTPPAHADWLISHLRFAEVIWVDGDHIDPPPEDERLLRWMGARIRAAGQHARC
jgi:pimeloyl-ACP methyl ester carboxylesterase